MAAKAKQFYIAKGFNIGVTDEEPNGTRYDAGTDAKPHLVDPKDFNKAVWADLVDAGAIVELVEE